MTALPPEIATGQHYLAHALHAAGVTHVFMVPSAFSGANAALDRLGVRVVVTHGEIAAAYMADAYARATHRPGVCFAQNIGASNLAAGLRDAGRGPGTPSRLREVQASAECGVGGMEVKALTDTL